MPSRADGTLPPERGGPKTPNLKEKASQASEREEKGEEMRSPGKGTPSWQERQWEWERACSPAPVPKALLIPVLRLVAVRRLSAQRRGLTEVVPDAPAKEGAPAQVTPASQPAVTAGPAQRILQSPHRAHPPSAPPAQPERPRSLSCGWREGRRNREHREAGGSSMLECRALAVEGRRGPVGGVGAGGGAGL